MPPGSWILAPDSSRRTPLPGIKYRKKRALYATSELFVCDSSKVAEKLTA
jgi:hypothetical protein